jgi:SHS2 domain-containing protein
MSLESVRPCVCKRFVITGKELDYLLVDWLNELLFAFEVEHLLLSRFDVSVDSSGLVATTCGEAIDFSRHRLEHEIKAITYHGLKVVRENGTYHAEVIVDI